MANFIVAKVKAIDGNSTARFSAIGVFVTLAVGIVAIPTKDGSPMQIAFLFIGGIAFIFAIILIFVWLKHPLTSPHVATQADMQALTKEVHDLITEIRLDRTNKH